MKLATWERVGQAALSGTLNLAVGQPALSLLPTEKMREAAARTIGTPDGGDGVVDPRYLLQYGAGPGNSKYLSTLAEYLSERLGHNVAPNNLFATHGNSQGLALVSRVLSSPGDTLLMEDPSYFLAHNIFKDNGLRLRPMAQHANSSRGTVDVEAVAALLEAEEEPKPKLLYLVPTANNPTGGFMPDADRSKLVSLCAQHGVSILADDVYELLSWGESHPRPLRWHAIQQGVGATVVSLGSWSKLLGPGLRLGWVEAEPDLVELLCRDGATASGGGGCPFVDGLVAQLVASGEAEAHRRLLNEALGRRAQALVDAINGELPPQLPRLAAPAGGYFLWVPLPEGADAAAFEAACSEEGVSALPGARCALDASRGARFARACFAFLEEEELAEAGRRLGRALAKVGRQG